MQFNTERQVAASDLKQNAPIKVGAFFIGRAELLLRPQI